MIQLDDKDACGHAERDEIIRELYNMNQSTDSDLDKWLFKNLDSELMHPGEFDAKFWVFYNDYTNAGESIYYDAWQHIIYNRCEDVVRSIDPNPEVCAQQSFPYVYYVTHNLNSDKIINQRCSVMAKSDLSLNTFDKPIYVLSSDAAIDASILNNAKLLSKLGLDNLPREATSIDVLQVCTKAFYHQVGVKMQFFRDKDIENCMFTLEPIPWRYFQVYDNLKYRPIYKKFTLNTYHKTLL